MTGISKEGMFDFLLKEIVYVLKDNDIPYYLDCGTLLGCIRERGFIEHDTDVDVATHVSFWDDLTKIDWKKYNLVKTREVGIKQCGGFLMSVKTKYSDYYCDIYANPPMPLLTKRKLCGRYYPIPVAPELYLTQLYGDWSEPKHAKGDKYHADWPPLWYKPDSKLYTNYSKFWDPSYEINLFGNCYEANDKFWDDYYKTNSDGINEPSSFASYIWLKYLKNKKLEIADLGCGNCRDSMFFSKKGHMCYAIDHNSKTETKHANCKLIKKDVEEVLLDKGFQVDIIYMRWFLHAMPYESSKRIFKNSINSLRTDGLMCIEVRSLNDKELIDGSVYDKGDKSYATTHKRWPYNIEMLETLAKDNGCEILSCEEDYFSPNKKAETHNPLLIRAILKKL